MMKFMHDETQLTRADEHWLPQLPYQDNFSINPFCLDPFGHKARNKVKFGYEAVYALSIPLPLVGQGAL
jgi:hypothetical protein